MKKLIMLILVVAVAFVTAPAFAQCCPKAPATATISGTIVTTAETVTAKETTLATKSQKEMLQAVDMTTTKQIVTATVRNESVNYAKAEMARIEVGRLKMPTLASIATSNLTTRTGTVNQIIMPAATLTEMTKANTTRTAASKVT